jgi:hypothetical protein
MALLFLCPYLVSEPDVPKSLIPAIDRQPEAKSKNTDVCNIS